jgi:hypothetical protein
MSQTITLTVPDRVFQPIQRVAEATDQPIEALLLTALEASLPPLEGLPPELMDDLTELERLDDQALWRVMAETVPLQTQRQIEELLRRNSAGSILETEREQLSLLQRQADLIMLRKARAANLLRFRGKRVPTLAELDQLTSRKTDSSPSISKKKGQPCGASPLFPISHDAITANQ